MENSIENPEEIKLFEDDGSCVALPNVSGETGRGEQDVRDYIIKDEVENVMAEKEDKLSIPNYVIDFTGIEKIKEFQLRSLMEFIRDDGAVMIYIAYKDGICGIGKADIENIHQMLPIAVKSIIGEQCKVYRNYQIGEKPKTVNLRDVSTIRLRL